MNALLLMALPLLAGCGSLAAPLVDGGAADLTGDAAATPVACDELGLSNIWSPVGGNVSLPDDLGRLLACQHVASLTSAGVSATTSFLSHHWTADTGYEQFIIQYLSQGPIGTPHKVTALLYLPTGGSAPYPLVAVNHGTNGMGPGCGPTHLTYDVDYMAIPLAGKGYAVVATDYQGMGVDDGLSPYGVGESEALSILDAVRAMRGFHDRRFDAASLSDELFLLGHSQGGQATLFAHQLYDPSVGSRLLGSITFAPGLGDLRGFNLVIGDPSRQVDTTAMVVMMVLYGNMAYHGAPSADSWLSAAARAQLPTILHDQCYQQAAASVQTAFRTEGDLFSPGFLSQAKLCSFTGPCPGFAPWYDDLTADIPGNFASSVPALLVQGEKDVIVPPYTTACVARRLKDHGTPTQVCGYASSDHGSIVDDSINDVLTWMSARRQGQTPSVCATGIVEACP